MKRVKKFKQYPYKEYKQLEELPELIWTGLFIFICIVGGFGYLYLIAEGL